MMMVVVVVPTSKYFTWCQMEEAHRMGRGAPSTSTVSGQQTGWTNQWTESSAGPRGGGRQVRLSVAKEISRQPVDPFSSADLRRREAGLWAWGNVALPSLFPGRLIIPNFYPLRV